MTVYVDDMRRSARVGRLSARWSHLQADTSAELHAFAARLGLRRSWAQHPGKPIEHYDLTDSKREAALRLGAVPITYMGPDSMDLIRRKTAAFKATGSPDLVAPIPATPAGRAAGMDFTSLDFETANHDRASVCSLGAVRVRGGQITDRLELKVAPPAHLAHFHPIHVRIHGLTAADVVGAPDWQRACSQLVDFAGSDLVVAHNAAFERSVVRAACADAGFPAPSMPMLCTVSLARKALPDLSAHKLPIVLQALGRSISNHHDALADAVGATEVMIGIAERVGASDPLELARTLRVQVK